MHTHLQVTVVTETHTPTDRTDYTSLARSVKNYRDTIFEKIPLEYERVMYIITRFNTDLARR